ncbi:MAG TPA: ABC transporter substrate-binding protein [Kofleriaceae bacterium]|nr:ABC transporter substrate-binding protein [Kofleriaceae bacterium]
MLTHLPKRIADRSLIFVLCTAALCAATACKKQSEQKAGGSAPASGAPAGGSAPAAAPAGGGGNKLVIGVLSDMSGLYADLGGQGSVIAAQMAAEEVGNTVAGMPIEIISADHQNKPDIGSNIAREWYDTKNVDVIVDVPTSSVALAVSPITADKNKVFLVNGAGTSDLTGAKCSPNTVHWAYDTWALANAAGREIVKNGGDTWFFLTVDYAFGTALERDTRAAIEANGGKVLGAVKHPLNTADFSSFLLQAQGSKAKVVALANAGGDTINSIKQASEFGIMSKGQQVAGLLVFIADINALGLPTAKGLILSESFYWDRDDNTRAFAKKFAAKFDGRMPTMIHAGVYASLLHYFKAINELKSAKDGKAVVAKMEATPTDDPLFGKGTIDPNGRKRHSMYVYQVKTPEESKAKWDYYKLIREVPADQAFRKPADSGCPLVK